MPDLCLTYPQADVRLHLHQYEWIVNWTLFNTIRYIKIDMVAIFFHAIELWMFGWFVLYDWHLEFQLFIVCLHTLFFNCFIQLSAISNFYSLVLTIHPFLLAISKKKNVITFIATVFSSLSAISSVYLWLGINCSSIKLLKLFQLLICCFYIT